MTRIHWLSFGWQENRGLIKYSICRSPINIILPKALAIANISRMATKGMVTKLPPNPLSMLVNGTSVPFTVVENGGILGVGRPEATFPVIAKGISDRYWFSRNASNVPSITTIALRDRARYLLSVCHFSNVPIFWTKQNQDQWL